VTTFFIRLSLLFIYSFIHFINLVQYNSTKHTFYEHLTNYIILIFLLKLFHRLDLQIDNITGHDLALSPTARHLRKLALLYPICNLRTLWQQERTGQADYQTTSTDDRLARTAGRYTPL